MSEQSDQPLAVRHSEPLAIRPAATQWIQSAENMLRLAIEKGVTPEALEKLLAMQERMKASAAKEAFDAALAEFQAQCPIIVKNRAGAKQAYKYAPIEEIVSQTRELMRSLGFSYTLTAEVEPGFVKATIKVTHVAGHSQCSDFKVPVDNKNPMMTEPQRYGGAMTFAKRYCFCNSFGILTADEDLDSRDRREKPTFGPQRTKTEPEPEREPEPDKAPAQTAPASSDDAKALKSQIWNHVRTHFKEDMAAFSQWCWDEGVMSDTEELKTLPTTRLRQLLAACQERIK